MAPKAQKTSKRNRKTSRPRRSSARIAQERVRSRSRSAPSEPPRRARSGTAAKKKKSTRQPANKTNRKTTKKTAKSAPRKSPPRKKAAKRGGTKVRRLKSREREPVVRRGRLIVWLVVMGVFGFGTVYVVDAAFRTLGNIEVSSGDQISLWDKLVDRMLDRDVPRVLGGEQKSNKPKAKAKKPAAKKPAAKAPAKAPVVAAPAPRPKVESLPKAKVPKTPRADLTAISPDEYAKAAPAKAAPAKAEPARAEPAEQAPQKPRTREEAAEQSRRRIDAILQKVGVESR